LDKGIYVGVYRDSVGQMSKSKGLSVLRGVTPRGRRNLWTPFVPAGWSPECFDRLFVALGFEDWRGGAESLYEWRGTETELVAISLRLDTDHKIAAIRANADDFAAVWDAVMLLMPDRVEFDYSVNLRDGVENSGRFSDLVIISSREPPQPGLEDLQPIAEQIDRLLEGAAMTVMARVNEQQQPALVAIHQRFERF
jgi:hypothetical protein